MSRQINQRWRPLLWGAITVVSLLGAAIPAFTQDGSYKVGDPVEVFTAGMWNKAKIVEVKENGEYLVLFYWGTGAQYGPKSIRPLKTEAPTKAGNTPTKTVGGAAKTPTATAQKNKSIGQRFGSREPRTLQNSKAPARGAITAALAKKYFSSQAEGVWAGHLYLVENVKLEVGGGVPYHPTLGAFDAVNVRVPLYPIRGSYLKYQCLDPETEYVGPAGKNANTYNNPKATGYCYKTTFGDWRCNMADPNSTSKENFRKNVAPPKR